MSTKTDSAQRAYAFLQALAADLSTERISFPTFTGATLRVRTALADPAIDADRLAQVLSAEPLLCARLIQIANSVAMNPGGKPVADVRNAVLRVGHDVVRATAVAVAMDQLRAAKDVQVFHEQSEWIWRHSLEVAAIAYVVTRKMTRLNADEALFAGLVHDIGRFYLLSRVSRYPELDPNSADVEGLQDEWHAGVGHAILCSLNVPEEIAEAVNHHEEPIGTVEPRNLAGILNIANRVSHGPNPLNGLTADDVPISIEAPQVMAVLAENTDALRSLASSLKG